MDLKSLLVDSKTAWVEFPGMEGFEVELANLSRKELVALRKRCTTNKFDRKSRAFNETLDENKFLVEFTNAVIKNWKGLKLKYLEDINIEKTINLKNLINEINKLISAKESLKKLEQEIFKFLGKNLDENN